MNLRQRPLELYIMFPALGDHFYLFRKIYRYIFVHDIPQTSSIIWYSPMHKYIHECFPLFNVTPSLSFLSANFFQHADRYFQRHNIPCCLSSHSWHPCTNGFYSQHPLVHTAMQHWWCIHVPVCVLGSWHSWLTKVCFFTVNNDFLWLFSCTLKQSYTLKYLVNTFRKKIINKTFTWYFLSINLISDGQIWLTENQDGMENMVKSSTEVSLTMLISVNMIVIAFSQSTCCDFNVSETISQTSEIPTLALQLAGPKDM